MGAFSLIVVINLLNRFICAISMSRKRAVSTDSDSNTASSPTKKSTSSVGSVDRLSNGVLIFKDFPDFKPNLTPKEVLQLGSFGGTYFRSIYSGVTKQKYGDEVWQELPKEWLEGLNVKKHISSQHYDENVNKYKAKCGGSLDMWESSGWIKPCDPYGWFQWYCRFYQGRRCEDDERQVGRWLKCAGPRGRWKNNLISKIVKAGKKYDDVSVSPVVRQVLQHWGYALTEADFNATKSKFQK